MSREQRAADIISEAWNDELSHSSWAKREANSGHVVAMLADRIVELEEKLAEAERDRERLDWLATQYKPVVDPMDRVFYIFEFMSNKHADVRVAIDAARAQSSGDEVK